MEWYMVNDTLNDDQIVGNFQYLIALQYLYIMYDEKNVLVKVVVVAQIDIYLVLFFYVRICKILFL